MIKTLPNNLQEKGNISTVKNELGNATGNKILNYKHIVNSV